MTRLVLVIDTVSRLFGLLSILLLIAAVLVVCEMVFIRYVLRGSTVWQTEFVTYSLMAATFLGSAEVMRRRGHVNVDLLPNALPPGPRRAMERLALALSLLFVGLLAWSGWTYFHEAWEGGWTTETVWKLPLWIPLLPLPLGMGWLCLQLAAEMIRDAPAADPGPPR